MPVRLFVVTVLALLGACGDGGADDQQGGPGPSEPSAMTTDPAGPDGTTPTSAGPPGTVSGVVILRSDVETIPDEPLDRGVVIVVPAGQESSFWRAVGLDAAPDPLGVVHASVDPAALPPGAAVAGVAADGSFSADLAAGDLLVCLADTGASATQGPPHELTGCVRVTAAQAGAPLRIELDRAVQLGP